jgi:hypothetical protein
LEFSRQIVKNNNGKLLATSSYLRKRGWNSPDVITRAKRELLNAGFIFETVMGHRPNKASWYAVTWRSLDKIKGFDPGSAELFRRGAYAEIAIFQPKLTRDAIYKKWRNPANENATLNSPNVIERVLTAPANVIEATPISSSDVSIGHLNESKSSTSYVDHLEKPSPAVASLLWDQP